MHRRLWRRDDRADFDRAHRNANGGGDHDHERQPETDGEDRHHRREASRREIALRGVPGAFEKKLGKAQLDGEPAFSAWKYTNGDGECRTLLLTAHLGSQASQVPSIRGGVASLALMSFDRGTILANTYRCERELGAGGMGRVFEATHLVLRTRVALKVLTLTISPASVQRFLREARLAVRLTSPHVARVLDAGQLEDGVPYIAMELLEGADLAKVSSERGPLRVDEACRYVRQACAGVAEAHEQGIVHRDIKLANLFLAQTHDGPLVKVLDFGCAKAERTSATSVAHATHADIVLGTPRYMPPEQLISPRDADARSDVWALGVVLYTLITGRPPFDAQTLRVLLEQIVTEPHPPIARALPPGLGEVIDRCLQKTPAARFANAGELAHALEPFARSRASWRVRFLVIAAVALLSTGVGASAAILGFRKHAPAATITSAPPATTIAQTSASAPASSPPVAARSSVTHTPLRTESAPSITTPTLGPDDLRRVDHYARAFCASPHLYECFPLSEDECIGALRKIAVSCGDLEDIDTCVSESFRKRYHRFATKNCDDY